jgi:hypothetical protein
MYTSVILEMGTLDFSMADLMAVAPNWGAERSMKLPLNLAVGVREAERM